MPKNLSAAYGAKRVNMSKKCQACATGSCMAHGGKVEQGSGAHEQEHESQQASHELSRDTKPKQPNRPMIVSKQKYSEGGAVKDLLPLKEQSADDNHELDVSEESTSVAPHELLSRDVEGAQESSMDEQDLPRMSESLSLADEVMMDRKRRRMAEGGRVEGSSNSGNSSLAGNLNQKIDAPDMSDLDNDSDELPRVLEDGRDSRGLNAESTHSMEDNEHYISDASLVAQIMRERRKSRGMK